MLRWPHHFRPIFQKGSLQYFLNYHLFHSTRDTFKSQINQNTNLPHKGRVSVSDGVGGGGGGGGGRAFEGRRLKIWHFDVIINLDKRDIAG